MREYIDVPLELKEVNSDGTFSGYGSVFGNVDSYKEVVSKGAFSDSISDWKSKGRLPALLWQHRTGEPIGVYKEMREDDHGLMVRGELALKTVRGSEAYELMKIGAVGGLSIGFNTREDSLDKGTGIRTLNKVDLWEVSVVTFPANQEARIATVKQIDDLKELKDIEHYLRESGGFSRSQAVALVSRIKAVTQSESEGIAKLKAAIEKRGQLFVNN